MSSIQIRLPKSFSIIPTSQHQAVRREFLVKTQYRSITEACSNLEQAVDLHNNCWTDREYDSQNLIFFENDSKMTKSILTRYKWTI